MHATKQSGDGTSAEYESGRTCEESARSPGHASHEKPLCAHARRSRVQLRLYCTCRCNLNLPQALFFQAAPVGSAIQDSRVADLVHLSRLADDCRMESFYRCKLDNENTIGKSILIMLM
jgi:hypothetical protein